MDRYIVGKPGNRFEEGLNMNRTVATVDFFFQETFA